MERYLFYALFTSISAALLAGCGAGSQPTISAPNALGVAASASRGQTKQTQQRIYVVENHAYSKSSVQIYSYPDGEPKGQLNDLGAPYGDCADSHGDVFILNQNLPPTILEYAPGGKTPIKVFEDTGYSPTGCSVDPTTGNLAVTNFYSSNYTSGTIAVFAPTGTRGQPTLLTDPNMFSPRYCGYDANGNLFVDGYSKSLQILFAELPANTKQFNGITLNQTINEPGDLQWDGKYMAIGDSSTNAIYQFSFEASTGKEVGSTTLGGVTYGLTQFWIVGSKVVGAAAVDQMVGIWKYPAGGTAVKVIKEKAGIPVGIAVSSP